MKRLLLISALFLQSGGNTINVPIQNPSFEDHPPLTYTGDPCGVAGWSNIPGWQLNGAWLFQMTPTPTPSWPCYYTPPPDGSTVLKVSPGQTVFQDLGIKIGDLQTLAGGQDGDGLYMMQFFVANRINAYPGYFEVLLMVGTHELCSSDGWATRNWKNVPRVCTSPSYIVYDKWPISGGGYITASPSDHLGISIHNDAGWDLMFDNVSLTFTPTN